MQYPSNQFNPLNPTVSNVSISVLSNSNIPISTISSSHSLNTSPLINVVYNPNTYIECKNIVNISVIEDISSKTDTNIYTNSPLLRSHNYTIYISNKTERVIERIIPTKLRKAIHPDLEVAKELCLLFLSKLSSTYFDVKDGGDGWKNLNSKYLREYFSTAPSTYKRIIEALEFEHNKGSILICDYKSQIGKKSHSFKLGDNYIANGLKPYLLTSNEARKLYDNDRIRMLKKATDNSICKNLFEFYKHIQLPTLEEIETEAKRLISLGYTKKSKVLKFRNKHRDSYFKNPEQITFVEDAIELYNHLTKNGLLIPQPTTEIAGYRVVDSFTLMPSWIRSLVKYKGKPIVESDYSALHPNIVIALYGGKTSFLTHQHIAEQLGINEKEIKVEHLSFFNKKIWQMKASLLYKYYLENEPTMLNKLISEKQKDYKITSTKMFTKEVQLMTSVVEQLNAKGIYVGYVYDALMCSIEDSLEVVKVMNETAIKLGIKTATKLSKQEPQKVQPKIELPIKSKRSDCLQLHFSQIMLDWELKERLNGIITGLDFVNAVIKFDDGTTNNEKVLVTKDEYTNRLKYVPYQYLCG